MASGISFGHFNIVGGEVQESGPYVAVIEDSAPAESRAELYIVVEPAAPGSEALCAEVLQVIHEHFGRPQYSLTGNLLQSLRAAQELLRTWNKRAPLDQRAAVGATCLTVSGDRAYLAQVGQCLTYVRHGGHLRCLRALEQEARAPLGTTITCAPCFARVDLSRGDTLLLVASSFERLADESVADAILSLPPGEALPEIYRRARAERDFGALYLAVTGDLRASTVVHTEAPVEHPADDGEVRRVRQHRAASEVALDRGQSADGRLERMAVPIEQQPAHVDPVIPRSSELQRRQIQRLTERRIAVPPRPALYTVAALIGLGLAGWFGLPRLVQTGKQDRYSALMLDARRADQGAGAAGSTGQKRILLERAQADLTEAGGLRPGAPELLALQTSTAGALAALNAMHQLGTPRTVLDLTMTPILAGSVSEFVGGPRLYLLDSSSGKVYAVDPNTSTPPSTPIFEAGKTIENIPTGMAQHIAWQTPAAGQPGRLYILDSNRRLFSFDHTGSLEVIHLAAATTWKSATAMAVSGGDLYILDSAGNQIWQYTSVGGQFPNPPRALLAKAGLHDAAQLSVAGDVYVATVNGRLLRLSGAGLQEVTPAGIDQPLRAPQAPLLDPRDGLRLIADTSEQRIVAVDAAGAYRMQYTGAALEGLRTVALDPSAGIVYALDERSIIAASIR